MQKTTCSRLTARFEGDVQGVGFRWRAVRLVRERFPQVTGEVRNEFDGSVSLVAEGAEGDLRRLYACFMGAQFADGIETARHCYEPVSSRRYEVFSAR
ncbi:MAG: acylphosphatase [Kiritimatiellae bacterium]|nr:acylphosphatase [Kiritimatiellia bacterium]